MLNTGKDEECVLNLNGKRIVNVQKRWMDEKKSTMGGWEGGNWHWDGGELRGIKIAIHEEMGKQKWQQKKHDRAALTLEFKMDALIKDGVENRERDSDVWKWRER